MAGLYNFFLGVPGKLGVGVADRGLERNATLPNYSGIGANRQVRRTFLPTQAAFGQMIQDVPTVSPLGSTGSFFHGVPILGRLAQKN